MTETVTITVKPKGPHPLTTSHRSKRVKLSAPLPARPSSSSHPASRSGKHPSLPIKNVQGVKTRRTDTTRDGWERDVVFVTRNTPLGGLMGRCRSLVMDEGYTRIRLHALSAAIPHALLLLHALMDVLPYPKGDKGMWYEIRTGSTECIEEVKVGAGPSTKNIRSKGKGKGKEVQEDVIMGDVETVQDEVESDFGDLGGIEEEEPERVSKLRASIEIDLHIGPKRQPKSDEAADASRTKVNASTKSTKRTRPSKRKRELLKRIGGNGKETSGNGNGENGDEEMDEEAAMNDLEMEMMMNAPAPVPHKGKSGGKGQRARVEMSPDEEEEELENR